MTPTPPSTTSSSGTSPNDAQFRVVRKRNRVPLSCGPCRHRKLKCNRASPCDNCTKRGDTASCTYATPASRKKNSSANGTNSTPDEMQNRIDRLEGLVLSLMGTGGSVNNPGAAAAALSTTRSGSLSTPSMEGPLDMEGDDMIREEGEGEESDVETVAKGIGFMKVDNGRSMYASDAHWYTVLSDISEVKAWFAEHKHQYAEQIRRVNERKGLEESPGTPYILRTSVPDRQEVLSNFPTKPVVDKLVARYFNTYDPTAHIIHGPTFQKQYDAHWLTPSETPALWLGMVFAMMTLALQSYHRAGDEPPEYQGKSWELSAEYRQFTAQCLILADYTQPLLHVLETLILHVQAEYARSKDSETGVMLLVSIMVRLAMRMGYHRDPRPYPTMSPFQGEMRRRVWAFVRQADLHFSFQFGLPNTIRSGDCDTEIPRNLYDDEMWEDMKTLPPSRPDTEATPVSYMNAKAKLSFIFGRVVEHVGRLIPPSYDEIMKLDEELRRARSETPPYLQFRPVSESSRDSANLIMQRYNLELLYLKSVCVLHRKFLGRGRENHRYAYSRRTCIEAAMDVLSLQSTLQVETGPGGRLRSVKWFIASLTSHDFLLAAMIVCLDLYLTSEAERQGKTPSMELDVYTQERREEMFTAIERSVGIWEGLRDQSIEAFKASTTLRVMLNKLRTYRALRGARYPVEDSEMAPEQSAAMTLGMLSSGGLTPNTAGLFNAAASPSPYPSNMANLLNEPSPDSNGAAGSIGKTGMTPNYTGLVDSMNHTITGTGGPASPFTALFNYPGTGFQNLEMSNPNIDWDAWDSYVQGSGSMEPAWSMTLDHGLSLQNTTGVGTTQANEANIDPSMTNGAASQSPNQSQSGASPPQTQLSGQNGQTGQGNRNAQAPYLHAPGFFMGVPGNMF